VENSWILAGSATLCLALSFPCGASSSCGLAAGTSESQAREGLCGFNSALRAFAGTRAQQAKCLLQTPTVARAALRNIVVPTELLDLIGSSTQPSMAQVRHYLAAQHIDEADIGGAVDQPIMADYFVIHDTSTPNCSEKGACPVLGSFPPNINSEDWIENRTFNHYKGQGQKGKGAGHVMTNRVGTSITEADLKDHVSHVKFDYCVEAWSKKNLFVGVENIQPRIGRPPVPQEGTKPNDFIAPVPGFSDPQYKRLALVYVIASARRGHWLIPAYHAVLDWYFSDGHDDPQNFDLSRFGDDVLSIVGAMVSRTS
jgi:hypothetical protein